MKYICLIFFILSLVNCDGSREKDSYEIYNTVLKDKVSTYGIILNYIHFPNNFTKEQTDSICIIKSDSLRKSKSLTYYLDNQLTILDTLRPDDIFQSSYIEVEQRPTYSKNKINFSKINDLGFAKRLNQSQKIDVNERKPTYLGSYDLSEPVFISKDKAVMRFQHYCAGNCGIGLLFYLKKVNGVWKIVKEKEIWIS